MTSKLNNEQISSKVSELLKVLRRLELDAIDQVTVLKSAASLIEHSVQADAMRVVMLNALNSNN